MTIKASIKQQVIQMHQQKMSRNQIVNELGLSGIKISTGSISNIISALETKNNRNHKTANATIKVSDAPTKTAGSTILDEIGLLDIRNQEPDIDFDNIAYPDPYPININNVKKDFINNVKSEDVTVKKEEGDIQQSALSDSTDTRTPITDEEPLLMDWNPDDSHEKVFWRRIMAEKKQRQEEYQMIQREREILEGERRQLAQKLVEYEALIESIKESEKNLLCRMGACP